MKFLPALEVTEFALASSFLEARVGGARPVITAGECHVERVSSRGVCLPSAVESESDSNPHSNQSVQGL